VAKNKSLEEELNALPDSDEEDAFNSLPDDTPTGLPSINENTGPSLGEQVTRSLPGGALAETVLPGLPSAVEKGLEAAPGALKSTAKSLVSPENLIPTAASVGVSLAGAPGLAPVAAGLSSAAYEVAKDLSAVPPVNLKDYLLRSVAASVPGFGAGVGMQVKPKTLMRAAGAGVTQAALESIPLGGLKKVGGSFKDKVVPEFVNTARELGVEPTLSQVTRESGWAKFLDFVSGGVFASAVEEARQVKNLRIIATAQKELAKDLASDITQKMSREQIGESFREGIEEVGILAQKAVEDSMYKRLDDVTGGVRQTVFEAPRASILSKGYVPYKKRVIEDVTKLETFPGQEEIVEVVRNPATGLEERIVRGYRSKTIERPVRREVEKEVSGEVPTSKFEEPYDPFDLKPVERRVGGIEVPTTGIKRYIDNLSETAKSSEAVRLIENIRNESRTLPFSEMQALRSELLKISRNSNDVTLVGLSKNLSSILDQNMETAAKEAGDDVYALWRNANAVTREGYETFKTDLLSRLILNDIKSAEYVGEGIYRKGSVTAIKELEKAAKRAELLTNDAEYKVLIEEAAKSNPRKYGELLNKKVISKEIMDTARLGYYQSVLNDVRQTLPDYPNESFIQFGKLKNIFEDQRTKETMQVLFSKEEMERIQKLANLGAKVEKKIPQNMVPFYRVLGTTADLMLGTGVGLAKMLQNPTAVRFLTEGLETMATGTRTAIQSGTATALRAAHYLLTNQTVEEMENANSR
jgi:hypothetical protein